MTTQTKLNWVTKFLRSKTSVALLLLGGVIIGLFWQVDRLLDLTQWVDHTDEVIAKTHYIEKQVIDLETGIRGFLITEDAIFLEPYHAALKSLPSSIAEFRTLTADNPPQGRRMDQMEELLELWKKHASEVTQKRLVKYDPASLIQSRHGKSMVDSMRSVLAEILAEEHRLKTIRVESVQTQARFTFKTLTTTFLACCAILVRGLIKNRAIDKQDQS